MSDTCIGGIVTSVMTEVAMARPVYAGVMLSLSSSVACQAAAKARTIIEKMARVPEELYKPNARASFR